MKFNWTYIDVFHPIDYASFLDTFDEGVAGSVVCDGESKSVFALGNFNLLGSSFFLVKEKVIY